MYNNRKIKRLLCGVCLNFVSLALLAQKQAGITNLLRIQNTGFLDERLTIAQKSKPCMKIVTENDVRAYWQVDQKGDRYRFYNPFTEQALAVNQGKAIELVPMNSKDLTQWWVGERKGNLVSLHPTNFPETMITADKDGGLQLTSVKNYIQTNSAFFMWAKTGYRSFSPDKDYAICPYLHLQKRWRVENRQGDSVSVIETEAQSSDVLQKWKVKMLALDTVALYNVAKQAYLYCSDPASGGKLSLCKGKEVLQKEGVKLYLYPVEGHKGLYCILLYTTADTAYMYTMKNGKLEVVDYEPDDKASWVAITAEE